jgi:tripartite ATP-independent transporter DctM subunit
VNDATARPTHAGTSIVGVARAFGAAAAAAVVAMTAATVYDVVARYFFNSPTAWATEISTYILVAIVFVGAARAHLDGANVRVEVLIDRLRGERRLRLELVAAWVALLFVVIAAWQAALLVLSDYRTGARIFSLLLTPSWLPKAPIAIGLAALAAAILVEIERLSPSAAGWRRSGPYALFAAVAVALVAFGPRPPAVPPTKFDAGSMLVLVAVLGGAFAFSGPRVGAGVAALIGGIVAAFLLGSALGVGWVTALLAASIVVTLALGVRIGFALGLVGLASIYFLAPAPFPVTVADRTWTAVNSFALTAVPLFVLMGALLVRSGLSDGVFTVAARLLGRLPGGLAHAGTAGCAVFAAVSGSSVATAATIGTVACPEMIRRGYSRELTYGSVAAGGTLGILIPPSVPLIVYGSATGVPIATLFIAGILPGILMTALFMAVIAAWATWRPAAAPRIRPGDALRLEPGAALDIAAVVLLILLVIASLYAGLATPSEVGALGAFASFALCLARGRIGRDMVLAALAETVNVTSFVFLIVVGASVLTFGFDLLKVSAALMSAATGVDVDRWVVFAVILAVYVVLGMFLDSISMIVLTLPVVFPLVKALGFDPVWFGIILVIMAEVGLVTPPVGMNLFVLQGIARGVPIGVIAIGALPFLGAMLLTVLLLCFFPAIALWLTAHLK